MEDNIYTQIKDIIIWSKYYDILSDKTDLYSDRKRIVITKDLAVLGIKYAEEQGLNKSLVELIIYARDLGFYQYGEIGYNFIKQKYDGFDQAVCSIEILIDIIEEYNKLYEREISIPDEVIYGIQCSFNKDFNPQIKEALLIHVIEETYYENQKKFQTNKLLSEDIKDRYIENLEYVWAKYIKDIELTNKNIAKNILKFSETSLEELGSFYEE